MKRLLTFIIVCYKIKKPDTAGIKLILCNLYQGHYEVAIRSHGELNPGWRIIEKRLLPLCRFQVYTECKKTMFDMVSHY